MSGAGTVDPSKTKWAVWIPIIVTISSLLGSGFTWGVTQYLATQKEIAENKSRDATKNNALLNDVLLPIRSKLKISLSISQQLKPYDASGLGILESYVWNARQGDTQKLALSFPFITDLMKIDTEISSLLERYTDCLIPAFKTASDNFLVHAHTYIIRIQNLPSVVASGASLPRWKPFPTDFSDALESEIAARQALAQR